MVWSSDGKDILKLANYPEDYANTNAIGGSFFAFFDTTYVQLSLGLGIVGITYANKDIQKAQKDANFTMTLTTFDIGVLGKFPIDMGAFTLFPALGFQYRVGVEYERNYNGVKSKFSDSDESPSEWLSTFWINFGVGADIPLSDSLYLRAMFLYGIGSLNKADKEYQDARKDLFTQINHGLDISVAIGFRF
jgi:hypothetical protein